MATPKGQEKKKKKRALVFVPDWPADIKEKTVAKVAELKKADFVTICKNPAYYDSKQDAVAGELEVVIIPDPKVIKACEQIQKDFKDHKFEVITGKAAQN